MSNPTGEALDANEAAQDAQIALLVEDVKRLRDELRAIREMIEDRQQH